MTVQVTTTNLYENTTGSGTGPLTFSAIGPFIANGASNVTVVDPGYTVGDFVLFALVTPGGTVGNPPKVTTGTTGTGFTASGTASDTSTYQYIRFTAAAKQTS